MVVTGANAALHALLPKFKRVESQARSMITEHLNTVEGGHVAWSGGKDSTLVAHLANEIKPGIPIVTYLAGTENNEVLQFCQEMASQHDWNWETVQVGDIIDVLKRGPEHVKASGDWWEIMIAGPARIAHERHGRGLLWGLRMDESKTRRVMLASTKGVRERLDGIRTCAPLWRWEEQDIYAAHAAWDIELCPIYRIMEKANIPVKDRRVGRMVGRRNMAERARQNRGLFAEQWSGIVSEVPWLGEI